jgi:hypothetical protein
MYFFVLQLIPFEISNWSILFQGKFQMESENQTFLNFNKKQLYWLWTFAYEEWFFISIGTFLLLVHSATSLGSILNFLKVQSCLCPLEKL